KRNRKTVNICTLPPPPLNGSGLPPVGLGSRAHFPELQFAAYLAHAAISPAHLGQQAAVQRALTDLAHFGAAAFPAYQAQRERLREGLAQLLSVPVRQVALTPGTTRSITDIALS